MPTRVPRPTPPTYPHASEPLTAEQVREQYGPLLDRFYTALEEDPHFVADLGIAILRACEKRGRVLERVARDKRAKVERTSVG